MTRRRRVRASTPFDNFEQQAAPAADQTVPTPPPVSEIQAEDAVTDDAQELPARKSDVGPVIDPSLLSDELDESRREPPGSAGANDDLEQLIDEIVGDESGAEPIDAMPADLGPSDPEPAPASPEPTAMAEVGLAPEAEAESAQVEEAPTIDDTAFDLQEGGPAAAPAATEEIQATPEGGYEAVPVMDIDPQPEVGFGPGSPEADEDVADDELKAVLDEIDLSDADLGTFDREEPPASAPAAAADEPAPSGVGSALADDADLWAQIEVDDTPAVEQAPSFADDDPAGAEVTDALEDKEHPAEDPVAELERAAAQAERAASGSEAAGDQELAVADPEFHNGQEAPKICVAARQARLAGANALPIDFTPTVDPKQEIDEINHALGAFADLEYGQLGFLRLSLRTRPEFKAEAKSWLAARKMGEDPDAKVSKWGMAWAWMRYFGSYLAFHLNDGLSGGRGGVPPTPPHKRGEGLKKLSMSDVSEDEKQAWKEAGLKSRDPAHFEAMLRVGVVGSPEDQAELERIAEEAMAGLEAFDSEHENQKMAWGPADPYDALLGLMGARALEDVPMVLSAIEAAALAHVPDDLTSPHGVNVVRSTFKTMPLANPIRVDDEYEPPKGVIPIGIQNPRSEDAQVIGIRNSELDRHMVVAGKTGTGKSELMKWLIFGVAKAGYPLVVDDPHGALCDDVLKALIVNCPERIDDIVFCDLSDSEWPVAFNPLDIHDPAMVEPTVQSVMEMLATQMKLDSTGAPRATIFAKQALTALCEANLVLEDPDTKCTLLDVVPFFNDGEFRQLVVNFSQNLAVRQTFDFDNGPFEQMGDRQKQELAAPINRAFSMLAASSSFSAVFSSGENKFNLGRLVSENKIVLVKLARFSHQAQLGEFVGSLIVPWLLASMDDWGRKKDSETGQYVGTGCRVFVDEAPRLFRSPDSSVIQALAEARKWDLGVIMAAQFLNQFPREVKESSLNNTASKIGLHTDMNGAADIAKAISGASKAVSEGDMVALPNFHFYGNILLPSPGAGLAPSGPFSAACLKPIRDELSDEQKRIRDEIMERSRRLVSNRLDVVQGQQRQRLEHVKITLSNKYNEQAQASYTPADLFDDEDLSDGDTGWANTAP